MTEVAVPQHNELSEQMRYAQAVAPAAMLPPQYRGKPADIVLAVGLGQAMGLSPAEALYRINIIQGKPTASAELIAANVRRAGHKLRVSGDERGARAVIIRCDDPDFEYVSEWNMDRARQLGLADKDGWKKQPGTMMRWRAVTEVARLACSETLYGVMYTPDELGHVEPSNPTRPQRATPSVAGVIVQDVTHAVVVPDEPLASPEQSRALHARFRQLDLDRDAALAACSEVLDRPVEATKGLTAAEVGAILDALAAWAGDEPTAGIRPVEDPPVDPDEQFRLEAQGDLQ